MPDRGSISSFFCTASRRFHFQRVLFVLNKIAPNSLDRFLEDMTLAFLRPPRVL